VENHDFFWGGDARCRRGISAFREKRAPQWEGPLKPAGLPSHGGYVPSTGEASAIRSARGF